MKVLFGARLFDGDRFLDDRALVVADGAIRAVVDVDERPRGGEQIDCGGGILAPGLIDWQVNGGGGVLFNAEPTVEGIAAIARAHRRAGVTGLLPTVVTDAPEVLAAALAAARAAGGRVPGALGVHVEGPFIDPRRPGIHPKQWIRPMREEDAEALIAGRAAVTLVTLAPASVPLALVERLANAGIVVSLGHTEATAEEAAAVFDAGARAATHLFNAMSQMTSRAPGVVGAALADPRVVCGLIADGEHVHPAACRAAIAAKGAAGIALVSDAMPPAAGGPDAFALQGRRMTRVGMKLVDENGTLAGSAITLADAVRYAATILRAPLASALAMATSTPARLLRVDDRIGRLGPGYEANLVHFGDDLALAGVWMAGRRLDEDGEPR
ncbi:N-acetylglucosamine 6-phosphate deacetylase [Roseiarcus fermentans]|uniref:N-acetylglucosamine 6-phosphate deacetylase n=1 Tax=Roseiarcus fermentans TaxID=1473586 RepID=A0A366FJH2_9HYPH|nr:N-acetylglucosamine-6-phosphate deacetylase [Roseiarcus fermentans]RBP13859.1 N-acetylglucosamine 6-phosphate deacetylase [Roseiarcus fermentans]